MGNMATIHNLIMRRALIALAALAASMLLVLGMAALPAKAQTASSGTPITVNTTADEDNTDGDCSLREAIKAANTNLAVDACPAGSASGEDTIGFNLGSAATTITLGSTLPTITDGSGLTIDGGAADAAKLTMDGGGTKPPFAYIDESKGVRIFYVNPGGKISLRNLTVAHGHIGIPWTWPNLYTGRDMTYLPEISGGAIYNGGTLTLSNVIASGNSAMGYGGAIQNRGSLTVTDSTFSDNWSNSDNTFNTTDGRAGVRAPHTIESGGAINNLNALEVTNTTFDGNNRSAISSYNGGSPNPWASAKVSNSTFTRNDGGIDSNGDSLEVSTSTFLDNFYNGGLQDSFALMYRGNSMTVRDTVMREPGTACLYMSPYWTIKDGGYNIDSGSSCGFSEANNSLSNTDPKLFLDRDTRNLRDNGGPTKTIALQADSPAIDFIPQGTNGCATDITEDQRGISRPQGPACDVGAFEAPPDVTAPAAPAIASPEQGSSNPACFTVSGTAEVNTTVELFEGDESLGTGGMGLSGKWSIALTDVPNGPHSYTAKATDPAGNTSTVSGTRALTVEWAAPEAPVITAPPQGGFDDDGSFSIVGTAEPGAEVELLEDGTSKGKTTAGPGGGWSVSLSGVAEGSHSYKAKVTEAACGASAESGTRTVIVDMTAPSVGKVAPAENATGIAARANVSALFSERMQPNSVRGAFKLYKRGSSTALKAKITYDAATKRAVLNPSADLRGGATYRAVVGTGAKDLASHALDQDPGASGNQDKVWTFKVRR